MKILTKESGTKGLYYIYEERQDGLFYQVTPVCMTSLRGYSEEYLTEQGFTLEVI